MQSSGSAKQNAKGEAATTQRVHGDTVPYPPADVTIKLEGQLYNCLQNTANVTARLDIRSTVTFSYSQPSDKLTRGGKRATKDETWSSLEGPCVDTTGTATSSRISVA